MTWKDCPQKLPITGPIFFSTTNQPKSQFLYKHCSPHSLCIITLVIWYIFQSGPNLKPQVKKLRNSSGWYVSNCKYLLRYIYKERNFDITLRYCTCLYKRALLQKCSKMNELISLFNYWIQFCKRVLDLNYSLLFYDLCLFASYPQSIRKLYLVLCYPERICQIGMTYLCSLGTETEIFSVSLLTKKPFFWQVYLSLGWVIT